MHFTFIIIFYNFCRNFAQDQLTYFRRRNAFHWVHVAPCNRRLPVEVLAEHVVNWYLHDKSLPTEIDGNNLKQLVSIVLMFSFCHYVSVDQRGAKRIMQI